MCWLMSRFRFDMAYKLERNRQNYIHLLIWHTKLKENTKSYVYLIHLYNRESKMLLDDKYLYC